MKRPRLSIGTPALLAVAAASTALGFFLIGPAAALIAAIWLLVLAARFDNHTGSCLMVTILALLAVAIVTVLFALTIMTRAH